jgi:hypothetical protein
MEYFELIIGTHPMSEDFYFKLDVSSQAIYFAWSLLLVSTMYLIGWSYRAENNTLVKAVFVMNFWYTLICLGYMVLKLYGRYFVYGSF